MSEPFKILADFLQQFEPDVCGHQGELPSEEIRLRIRSFARGTLGANEQRELLRLFEENPDWVQILTLEVKSLREAR